MIRSQLTAGPKQQPSEGTRLAAGYLPRAAQAPVAQPAVRPPMHNEATGK